MSSKVSVIIPTYNRSNLLIQALKSVLSQTYKNIEIIVVDDGSKDDTPEKLAFYIDKYKVKYIRQENQGLPVARNTGILNSVGRYISLLDDDDLWYPYTIRRQLDEFESNRDYGMVYSDAMVIDEKGNEYGLRANCLFPSGDIYEEVTSGRVVLIPGTIMFKRECIDVAGMFDPELRRYQDVDFVRKVAEKYKIKFIDIPLLKYRIHVNAMSTFKYDVRYIKKRYKNIFESERFKKMNVDFQKDIYSKYYRQIGKGYYVISNYKLALKCLIKSIYYSPKRLRRFRTYRYLLQAVLGKRTSDSIGRIFDKKHD